MSNSSHIWLFAAASILLCVCFVVSLIFISRLQRGEDNAIKKAATWNQLSLWIGAVGTALIHRDLVYAFMLQLLLNAYLLARATK